MVHDYAGRLKAPKKKRQTGWWFLLGVVFVLVVSGVVYFKLTHFSTTPIAAPKVVQKVETKSAPVVQHNNTLQFDFYTLLPEMKVKVPVTSVETASDKAHQTLFMLQIASLKSEESAVSLKNSLSSWGVSARVEMVQTGQTFWYRVLSGPYSTENEAETVQTALHHHHIKSLVIPLKNSNHAPT